MASPALLSADRGDRHRNPPGGMERFSSPLPFHKSCGSTGGALPGEGGCSPARSCQGRCDRPVKLCHLAEEKVRVCCDEELETSFTYIDENVNLETSCRNIHKTVRNGEANCAEALPELSFISEDDLSFGESSVNSVDYGFISAVTFLVTGISLVIISYVVPREVAVDRESVSAREMERLEMESARVGAHLDRCVIAGLCLLTLGGVVLSTLLMVSMWKGEMYRRKAFAYSKRSTKLYGSINLKARPSPTHSSAHLEEEIEETVT